MEELNIKRFPYVERYMNAVTPGDKARFLEMLMQDEEVQGVEGLCEFLRGMINRIKESIEIHLGRVIGGIVSLFSDDEGHEDYTKSVTYESEISAVWKKLGIDYDIYSSPEVMQAYKDIKEELLKQGYSKDQLEHMKYNKNYQTFEIPDTEDKPGKKIFLMDKDTYDSYVVYCLNKGISITDDFDKVSPDILMSGHYMVDAGSEELKEFIADLMLKRARAERDHAVSDDKEPEEKDNPKADSSKETVFKERSEVNPEISFENKWQRVSVRNTAQQEALTKTLVRLSAKEMEAVTARISVTPKFIKPDIYEDEQYIAMEIPKGHMKGNYFKKVENSMAPGGLYILIPKDSVKEIRGEEVDKTFHNKAHSITMRMSDEFKILDFETKKPAVMKSTEDGKEEPLTISAVQVVSACDVYQVRGARVPSIKRDRQANTKLSEYAELTEGMKKKGFDKCSEKFGKFLKEHGIENKDGKWMVNTDKGMRDLVYEDFDKDMQKNLKDILNDSVKKQRSAKNPPEPSVIKGAKDNLRRGRFRSEEDLKRIIDDKDFVQMTFSHADEFFRIEKAEEAREMPYLVQPFDKWGEPLEPVEFKTIKDVEQYFSQHFGGFDMDIEANVQLSEIPPQTEDIEEPKRRAEQDKKPDKKHNKEIER